MIARRDHTAAEIAELLARPTVSLAQAAACCGVGETALRGAIRRGEIDLPVLAVGARRLIPTTAIRRLLGLDEG